MEMGRRTFLKAAAAGAAGIVAAGTLVGCSGGQDIDPAKDWLPLGSVVRLTSGEGTDICYMIATRRPRASRTTVQDRDVELDKGAYDYAGIVWPIGFLSDLSEHAYTGELMGFRKDMISEVLFVGYQDDLEERAKGLLDSASDGQVADEILSDLYNELGEQAKEARGESE